MKVTLAVDVLCEWMGYDPAYRVYVDGDLMVERTYIWDNNHQHVRELLEVELEPGAHVLNVEPIINHDTLAHFRTTNFTINGIPSDLNNGTFTI